MVNSNYGYNILFIMRVLHIGSVPKELGGSYTTGVSNVIVELVKAQNKSVDARVYATNINNVYAKNIKAFKVYGYSLNVFKYIFFFFRHPNSSYKDFFFFKKLGVNQYRFIIDRINITKIIENFKPDIIHVHGIHHFCTVCRSNPNGIKQILTFHGYNSKEEFPHRILLSTMKAVRYITALTEDEKKNILNDFIDKKVAVIPNGTDSQKFYYSQTERISLRAKLRIPENVVVFITVASVQKRKGQLRFAKYLNDNSYNSFLYLILGAGNQLEELKKYIEDNNLENKVRAIGYVENSDLFKYYSAADVYAHVSFDEGMSLSELEADATGLKILVNKPIINTLPNNIDNEERFFVIDYESSDNEKDFAKWYARSNDNRHSNSMFDWSIISNTYLNYYRTFFYD